MFVLEMATDCQFASQMNTEPCRWCEASCVCSLALSLSSNNARSFGEKLIIFARNGEHFYCCTVSHIVHTHTKVPVLCALFVIHRWKPKEFCLLCARRSSCCCLISRILRQQLSFMSTHTHTHSFYARYQRAYSAVGMCVRSFFSN